MKRLLLIILLFNNFLVAYNQFIKGTVFDKKTRDKIVGAAVYFNGTFVGTLTDKNGDFRLDISKNSSMPLSISALGYYSVTLNSYSTKDSIIIQLAPKTFDLNEVVIRDKSLVRERKTNIRIFNEVFLGTTLNAGSCKILNENDITFNYKTDKDTLRAFARNPLKIENKALGYKITYYLDYFEYNRKNRTFFFKGNLVFNEEMLIGDTYTQSYEQQRINSYKGSRMHFFRELWADNLRDAGFTVLDPSGNELDYKKIVVEQNDHRKYLSFGRYLSVVYNPGHRDNKRNIYYYKNLPLAYNNNTEEDNSSRIVFLKDRVFFDSTGYFDGTGIRWQGQMVTQRISDFLPYEFQLNNKFLPLTTSGSTLIPNTLSTGESAAPVDSLRILEKVYLHTDRTYYYPGNEIWFKAYLIDAYDRSLSDLSRNLHVELISPSGGIISDRIIRLDGGLGFGDFRLPGSLSPGRYRLRAYTNYMRNFSDQIFFNKEINIVASASATKLPEPRKLEKNDVILNFFPEGGSLVDNVSSVVAFKAVDAQGKSCDVSGDVYSSGGDKVTSFRSAHLGMGSFIIKPVPGQNYYARVKGTDNNEIKSELPKSFTTGVTLNTSVNNDNELLIKIRTNDLTLPLLRDQDLSLSISSRKEIVKTISLRISTLVDSIVIPADDLPDGIVMLTLKTLKDLPLAERLIFIQQEQNLKINIRPDREAYRQRDSVSVKISVSGDSINQEKAFLSFSAAESNFMDEIPEYPTTIASWFLLESDVKGPVEGPSYYFNPANPERFKDLDLLLRTQGWRDFLWKYDPGKYFSPETGLFVSGRLRKLNRDRPLPGSKIHLTIFQDDNIISETVPTDPKGRFHFDNINIMGDASLVASASSKNGYPDGFLLLDSTNYMPAKMSGYLAASTVVKKEEILTGIRDSEIKERETKLVQEYNIKETTRKKYTLSDTLDIGEVSISVQRPRSIQVAKIESVRSVYGGQPDYEIIVTPQMENFPAAPELLMGRAGIIVVQTEPGKYLIEFHREMGFKGYSKINPLLIIDGVKSPLSSLDAFPVYLIDRIDILKTIDKTAVFGLDGANGVISVITRSGNRMAIKTEPGKHTVNTKFSGYDTPRIFYSPRHDPKSQSDIPDLRTTLFWKPDIILQTGKELLVKYYNADNASEIRIIVEGITSTGIPVTGTAEYQIKD